MPRSHRELMVAFQEGDAEAFEALYDRYRKEIINFFYKNCYDAALAEDLMQDTFLRVIRSRANYKPQATFRTFLYTVARNLWIDRHRSKKAAPKTVSTDLPVGEDGGTLGAQVESGATPVEEQVGTKEAADLVRTALLELPEPQRMVFVLAEAQGLKYREIAEVLGVPVGTVKSRMNAAVGRLRGLLEHVLR